MFSSRSLDLHLPIHSRATIAERSHSCEWNLVDSFNLQSTDARAQVENLKVLFMVEKINGIQKGLKGHRNRPEVVAKRMKERLHHDKRFIGHVPGVLPGERFANRAVLHIAGVHKDSQSGITYIPCAGYAGLSKNLADSIVYKLGGIYNNEERGNYKDETGPLHSIVYCGSRKKSSALMEAGRQNSPVRVTGQLSGETGKKVRGNGAKGKKLRELEYKGLYSVLGWWKEKSSDGSLEQYRFVLERRTNQEEPTVVYPGTSAGQEPALAGPAAGALLKKRPRTLSVNTPSIEYETSDSEHILKRPRASSQPEEVYPVSSSIVDDLLKTLARTLSQGSSVHSMDFHPIHQTILLAGTSLGELSVWEIATREKLVLKLFRVWDLPSCSGAMQSAFVKDPGVSATRVIWSPDGALVGVAFSKFLIHLYMYGGGADLRQHLEIEAHNGSVNDIAFSHPGKQLCFITCGDDKTIKVWDAMNARQMYVFEGHDAPVYSVCPHHKENIQFIFSTAVDGKIKAWLYDNLGSRVDYEAPGRWCTTMAYSADGSRLFSCGTSKEGESFLVEWNESEGAIKRNYNGFRKRFQSMIQFDTTRNRYLAAGEDFSIKVWDMDNANLLTTIDGDGGLPPTPRVRFNKEGSLLAISTHDNGIRILANNDGLRLVRASESRALEKNPAAAVTVASASATPTPVDRPNGPPVEVKPRISDDPAEKTNWKLADLTEQAHCRSVKLTDTAPPNKVLRLIYTNAGNALLALGSNAVHKLWKWQKTNWNVTGKATVSFPPHLWQPQNTGFMTNDTGDNDPEEAVPCIALSKNDSYVMSASGGKVLLFNMMTFKVMTSFMPPPPAATFLAFHPQDNFIAIGREDSTIHIYNVRVDEVKSKLKGHTKRITGLAFSNNLNMLVSSGADGQLCLWGTDAWDKRKSKFIQMPPGKDAPPTGDTRVQFDVEQTRLLVIHETQLAIYDAAKLEPIHQWFTRDPFLAPVSNATFCCDSELVYAAFCDGSVGVFETDGLRPRCRLAPSTYLAAGPGSSVYPLVVAAHPTERYQFALGLSDGGVQVLEPLEPDGKWGPSPVADNGPAAPNAAAVEASSEQAGARAT